MFCYIKKCFYFNNNTQKVYSNVLPRGASYSKLSFDSSKDKLYTVAYQTLYIIEIDEQFRFCDVRIDGSNEL